MSTSKPDAMPENAPQGCARHGCALDPTSGECPRCLLELAASPPGVEDPSSVHTGEARPRAAGVPPTLAEVRAAFPGLEVEALLGQGGMGAVFRARQPRLQRTVALKVLPRALGEDPTFAERFAREARALARLTHPGIVAVHDFGCADGLHYLVMEFVDGVNLRELLRRGPLEPRQALAIARALCDALQYAHDEGVVHRDVKPENVLVDARGCVKVADFGLAKLVHAEAEPALTRSDQVMGTPHYMAPEQLERPLEVDHRADLFALGVVLYEMLTGSLPRGKFEPPSRRVQVDVRLDQIVLRALEHEPTRRYQQALEIKTDVEHLPAGGGGAPPAAEPRPAPVPSGEPSRSPRRAHALRPGTHGWRAAGLLGLAWILLGLSWNLGPFAFGAGCLLWVSALGHLLRERVRAVPGWREALQRAHDRGGRRFTLFVGGLLCVLAIALGHFLHWEQGVHTWRPQPQGGVDALRERWGREPWALLRFAAAGEEVSEHVALTSEPRLLVESHHSSVPPSSEGLAFGLILAGFAGLAVVLALCVRVPESSELTTRAWSLGAQLAALGLGALLVLWVGAPLASLREPWVLQEVMGRVELADRPEAVLERLRAALREEGLALEVEERVRVVERREDRELATATLLRASAPDPFERWQTGFAGPVRTSPRLWITLAARLDGSGSVLELRAGLLDPRRPEHERTHELLRRLERALERA